MQAVQVMTSQSVILSDAIADAAGLNRTDLEALGLIHIGAATTPGDLARSTGLTTGAVTALLDRLERAGFIRRAPDAGDRRRVRVEPVPERIDMVAALYAGLDESMRLALQPYSEEQIVFLTEFISRCTDAARRHAASLRTAR